MRPASGTQAAVDVPAERFTRRVRATVVILAVVLVGLCPSVLATVRFSPFAGAASDLSDSTQPPAGPPTADPELTGAVLAAGSGGAPDVGSGGALDARWDGPAVHLDWSGGTYTAVSDSFVGQRTVVPGDQVRRTLQVTNDSPDDALLSVWVDPDAVVPTSATNSSLADSVRLEWVVADTRGAVTFASLLTQDKTLVVQLQVPRGESVPVTFGFQMPAATTDSARDGAPSVQLSFDVTVTMSGDTMSGDTMSGDRTGDFSSQTLGRDSISSQTLAFTGAQVAHLALLAALALVTGALLWFVGRRRRCTRCRRPLRRSHAQASRRVCPDCDAVVPLPPRGARSVPLDEARAPRRGDPGSALGGGGDAPAVAVELDGHHRHAGARRARP